VWWEAGRGKQFFLGWVEENRSNQRLRDLNVFLQSILYRKQGVSSTAKMVFFLIITLLIRVNII